MPEAVVAEAPGRVNLIGEHTDYHEGLVLPATIPQRTRVALTPRTDRRVRASSGPMAQSAEYVLDHETAGRGWLDYVQGVTAQLARDGTRVPGCEITIESSVPVGAGVSSSAALTVALLRAFRAWLDLPLDDRAIAGLAHAVETDFVGAPVGVMDQMAVSLGRPGEALFIDTRTLACDRLPLPRELELVIIDSGVPHHHAGGGYVTRRKESFEASALLGVRVLRDLTMEDLPRLAALPPMLERRARHIITENQRVLETTAALRRDDIAALGPLFAASHASLRDDYEVSTPDVDALVTLAQAHPDIIAARMTGGGFGGAVVMIARVGTGARAARELRERYQRTRQRHATVLVPPDLPPEARRA